MDLDTHLDYEVELAVIIGKKGSDIAKEDVEKYILDIQYSMIYLLESCSNPFSMV